MPPSSTYALPISYGSKAVSRSGAAKGASQETTVDEVLADDEDDHLKYGSRPSRAQDASWTSLPAALAQQYRTAGLNPSDPIPEAPFPHQYPLSKRRRSSTEDLRDTLASQRPPVYSYQNRELSVHAQSVRDDKPTLREQHLANLVYILHQSISRHDWLRAGRAWGLLLRSGGEHMKIHATPMDLRKDGRWAIGGEILLQPRPASGPGVTASVSGNQMSSQLSPQHSQHDSDPPDQRLLSLQSVRAAREYYERLAVQYPYMTVRKDKPYDFYLAMYSCWLYEVSERSRRERAQMLLEGSADLDSSMDSVLGSRNDSASQSRKTQAIRREELQEARKVATQLDELLVTPPFDKSPDLLHLRGMISLWLADLFLCNHDTNVDDGELGADVNVQIQAQDDRKREQQRAQDFFIRCKANGGRVWEGVLDVFNSARNTQQEKPGNLTKVSQSDHQRSESVKSESEDPMSD